MSSLADDLQAITLHQVVSDTAEYRLRLLYRWYSKTFATPLHLVPSLPLVDILVAFWESKYEEMNEVELEEERKRVIETDDERRARLVSEDVNHVEDDAFAAAIEEQARQESKVKKIEDIKVPEDRAIRATAKVPEPSLPTPEEIKNLGPLPESVSIKFADTNFFDELIEKLDDADEDRQSSRKP
jgi:hypothetical protein